MKKKTRIVRPKRSRQSKPRRRTAQTIARELARQGCTPKIEHFDGCDRDDLEREYIALKDAVAAEEGGESTRDDIHIVQDAAYLLGVEVGKLLAGGGR